MFNSKGKDFLDPVVIQRKQSNREEFILALTSDNTDKLLQFISVKEKLNDINVTDTFSKVFLDYSLVKQEILEIFLNKKYLRKHIDFNYVFERFVDNNNLELMKQFDYLINKTDDIIEKYLLITTQNNNLIALQFLIDNNKVTNEMLYSSLFKASALGNIKIVQYLLKDRNLDIHKEYDLALRNAGSHNKLEVVKYLLTNSAVKEKADPYALQDDLLITAIMTNNTVMLNYLYNDYKITESDRVKEYKKSKVNQEASIQ